MSYQEIADAFRREIQTVLPKISDAASKFGSIVKKSRRYPIKRIFTINTKDKTILHLIYFAKKGSDWDRPGLCIYSTFISHGQLHAISIDGPDGCICIHTGHFFDRYRERIINDLEISSEDLIKEFMIKNQDLMWYRNASCFSKEFKKHERVEMTQLAARVEEGNCFIDKIDNKLLIFRTILSDEMLGIDQSLAFSQLEQMRTSFASKARKKDK